MYGDEEMDLFTGKGCLPIIVHTCNYNYNYNYAEDNSHVDG